MKRLDRRVCRAKAHRKWRLGMTCHSPAHVHKHRQTMKAGDCRRLAPWSVGP